MQNQAIKNDIDTLFTKIGTNFYDKMVNEWSTMVKERDPWKSPTGSERDWGKSWYAISQ